MTLEAEAKEYVLKTYPDAICKPLHSKGRWEVFKNSLYLQKDKIAFGTFCKNAWINAAVIIIHQKHITK